MIDKKLGQEPAFGFGYNKKKDHYNKPGYEILPEVEPGMSKRFYAACAIAQGLCGNANYVVNTNKASEFTKICYTLADELLKQENE